MAPGPCAFGGKAYRRSRTVAPTATCHPSQRCGGRGRSGGHIFSKSSLSRLRSGRLARRAGRNFTVSECQPRAPPCGLAAATGTGAGPGSGRGGRREGLRDAGVVIGCVVCPLVCWFR
jgi:hypothetical protein